MRRVVLGACLATLIGAFASRGVGWAQVVLGGSESDHHLYFYNGGSSTGEWLKWNDAADRFELSDDLDLAGGWLTAGNVTGATVRASQLRVGNAASFPYLYFYAGGSETGQYLRWNEAMGRFVVSHELEIDGDLRVNDDLRINATGSQSSAAIGFYDTNGAFGGNLGWSGPEDQFFFTDDLKVQGALRSEQDVYVNSNGGEVSSYVFFYDGGSANGEWLAWDNGGDRFELSDDLFVNGTLDVGALSMSSIDTATLEFTGTDLLVNSDGPDGASYLYFYDQGSQFGEFLKWNDSEDAFHLSDRLWVVENLVVGGNADTFPGYNAFGDDNPSSGDMTDAGDVYVAADLEVGEAVYLSKNLYMEGGSGDGDQTIYFLNGGNRGAEYVRWDDSAAGFRISDDLFFGTETNDTTFGLYNNYDLVFFKDHDSDSVDSWFRWWTDNAAIEQMRIEDGDEAATRFDGVVSANGLDYAEAYKIADPTLAAGEVVSLDPAAREHVARSAAAYDPLIVGVVSARPGFVTGDSFEAEEQADRELAGQRAAARRDGDRERAKGLTLELRRKVRAGQRAVALAGRVPVKVDAELGAIRAGDYLTSSPTPGRAMVMTAAGPTLGVALEPLAAGRGEILALIRPGWHAPAADGPAAAAGGEPVEEDAGDGAGAPPGAVIAAGALPDGEPDGFPAAGGPDGPPFGLDEHGNLHVQGSIFTGSRGLAEYRPVSEPVQAGDVVVVDRQYPGALRAGRTQGDPAAVGIVVGLPGLAQGRRIARVGELLPELAAELTAAREAGDRRRQEAIWSELEAAFRAVYAPVATSGIARARVDAGSGAVAIGDLLTVSATRGHLMPSADPVPGTIVAKALEPLAEGTGLVEVLVMPR